MVKQFVFFCNYNLLYFCSYSRYFARQQKLQFCSYSRYDRYICSAK